MTVASGLLQDTDEFHQKEDPDVKLSITFRFCWAAVCTCLLATSAGADSHLSCTQDLAGDRLTLVVPNAPGGGYDTYARAIAPAIEKYSGTQVRVVNMPAAGGQAARSLVLNADADELILLIENTTDLAITKTSPETGAGRTFLIEGFDVLGIVHVAEEVWISRSDFDLTTPDKGSLVGAAGTLEEAAFSLFMPAIALGLESDLVTGYDGTSDQASAVLRGDVDVMSVSVTSGMRVASDEDLKIVLSLSNGPSSEAGGVPYLAGEGSITWQITKDLDASQRNSRRAMAQAVAGLRSEARGLHMSLNAPEELRNCMAAVIGAALDDADFIETAVSQGRPVAALHADQARQLADNMAVSMRSVISIVETIVAERSEK